MLLEDLICNLPDAHIHDISLDDDTNGESIKAIIHVDNSIAICPYCKEESHLTGPNLVVVLAKRNKLVGVTQSPLAFFIPPLWS